MFAQGCGNDEVDVQFLLDGSRSITSKNFIRIKDWVKSLISTLSVGKYKARIGI